MSIQPSNWVPPRLPTQPATPQPTSQPTPTAGPQMPRQQVTHERVLRQGGRAAGGAAPAGNPVSREAQLAEAREGRIDKADASGETRETQQGGDLSAVFERVEGRSAPSRDDRRDPSGVVPKPAAQEDSDDTVQPSDVVGLFARGRNTEEDEVKQLVRDLEVVQSNRLRRKIEVILIMARAGGRQDLSQMALFKEALRDVDMQFDELERVLNVRIREAKQAVAAQKVRAGSTASYLLIAADQYDRRQLRKRLEEQRQALRKAIVAASAASGALNAVPLIALLQALQDQIECELDAQEENLQSNSARIGAEQLKELEARRSQALRLISDAWRRAGETQSGLVGVFTEVRQGVEQRFEHQRDQVIDV